MDLLDDMETQELQPETLSKKGFAAHLGLSPGRVSQLVAQGLPVEPNGRISVERATGWYRRNVDPNRRQASTGAGDRLPASGRGDYDRIRAERARLALERERGALVDRAAVERAVFDRARGERDSWIGWSSRAAAALSSELGVDPGAAFAVLDRLVRDQLASLAARPMEDFE